MSGTWQSGWVTGDIVTAAELKKGAGLLYDTTLGADTATVATSPAFIAGYAHLLIVVSSRSSAAANFAALGVRLNGDSGANYDSQNIAGVASTPNAGEAFGQTLGSVAEIPAANAPAGVFGSTTIWIPDYANTARNKAMHSHTARKYGTTTGQLRAEAAAAFWRSNAAITSITFLASSGNLVTGSRFSVYALGA